MRSSGQKELQYELVQKLEAAGIAARAAEILETLAEALWSPLEQVQARALQLDS